MKALLLLIFVFLKVSLFGQIYLHDFGTTTISSNPYSVAPGTIDPSLTGSSWSSSTGSFTSFAGSSGQALSLNNSSGTPTMTLTFNVGSGCTLDITAFNFWCRRSASGAQNWSLSINGTNVGSGTVGTAGASIGSTPVSGMTGLTGTITIVLSLSGASGSGTFRLDDFELDGTVNCGTPSTTITTGSITGSPFTVTCPSTTATGSVAFTSTGTFTAGNNYTVQLSDASGSFASPTAIGTLTSTANTGSISITIPASTPTGSGYLIRVISSTPATTGSNSSSFTITQTGSCTTVSPYITSIIYNGCNTGGCQEGESEIVFANTSDYSLTVSSANININYPGSPTYDLVGTVVNNTATTTAMNTNAGCAGLFIDGFGLTLPPNTSFLMVPSGICLSALDWSSLCGTGPIYVIYGQSGTTGDTWYTGGNFGNSSGIKNFSVDFTTTSGSFTTGYSYNPPSSTDGNYATYGPGGGAAATQGNFPNCALNPIALSTDLVFYNGLKINNQSNLLWQTQNEINNDYFTIEHSTNGIDWKVIGNINGAGNSSNRTDYSFVHTTPLNGNNYYKLKSIDFNGTTYMKGIVQLEYTSNFAYYDVKSSSIILTDATDISIYSLEGKIMYSGNDSTSIPFANKGMYLIKNNSTQSTQRIVIY